MATKVQTASSVYEPATAEMQQAMRRIMAVTGITEHEFPRAARMFSIYAAMQDEQDAHVRRMARFLDALDSVEAE